jgi:hypothetical protein
MRGGITPVSEASQKRLLDDLQQQTQQQRQQQLQQQTQQQRQTNVPAMRINREPYMSRLNGRRYDGSNGGKRRNKKIKKTRCKKSKCKHKKTRKTNYVTR